MTNPFISDGDSYVYDYDKNEDNMSMCEGILVGNCDEGEYSILRNEVRATWPKRRNKYPKPHENAFNESSLTIHNHFDSQCNSPLDGSVSEIICRDVDHNINNLKSSIATLTQRLEDVSSERNDKSNLDKRLMDENQNLQMKIKNSEAQITQTDVQAREDLEKLRQSSINDMKRMLMTKNREIEECRTKLGQNEKELSNFRITSVARKNEVDKLRYDIIRLKEKINSNDQQYNSLEDEFSRLKEITQRETNIYTRERDYIKKSYEELQQTQLPLNKSITTLLPLVEQKMGNLHQIIQQLSHENRTLRETLEDSQAELLTLSLEEGRSLLRNNEISWASETDTYSKPELIDFVAREKDINIKLRQYSNKLISKIIEVDPSILEV